VELLYIDRTLLAIAAGEPDAIDKIEGRESIV